MKPDFSTKDDLFLFNQGPTKNLGKVQFHDYKGTFEKYKDLPNVATFNRQIELFKELLEKPIPTRCRIWIPCFSPCLWAKCFPLLFMAS